VNLLPKTPAIDDWLDDASRQLRAAGIEFGRLDAEIILAHTIRHNRTYIHAHGDDFLSLRELEIADARLKLRVQRVPLAYIIGHKEFYGRRFDVTPSTLIPRPETEAMVELLGDMLTSMQPSLLKSPPRLVDIGTGSGCIGITAKLEFPQLDVTLTDVSRHALNVAEKNARKLHADVHILKSDLLNDYPLQPTIVLANLPYVDHDWEVSPETRAEPDMALFADNHGLALIDKLIVQASHRLPLHGLLFLEADDRQHDQITQTAKSHGFAVREIRGLIICLQKV
jgi:release factor glutamine methyltransferase